MTSAVTGRDGSDRCSDITTLEELGVVVVELTASELACDDGEPDPTDAYVSVDASVGATAGRMDCVSSVNM